jgi:CBS domain-containing protein
MHRRFVELAPSDLLSDARDLMRMARLRHLFVIDDGILVGVLSYRDLLEAAFPDADPGKAVRAELDADARVADLMIPVPVTVTPTTPLREAAGCMLRFHLGCLPVIEGGPAAPRALGIVTEADLLRAAYASFARPA